MFLKASLQKFKGQGFCPIRAARKVHRDRDQQTEEVPREWGIDSRPLGRGRREKVQHEHQLLS